MKKFIITTALMTSAETLEEVEERVKALDGFGAPEMLFLTVHEWHPGEILEVTFSKKDEDYARECAREILDNIAAKSRGLN